MDKTTEILKEAHRLYEEGELEWLQGRKKTVRTTDSFDPHTKYTGACLMGAVEIAVERLEGVEGYMVYAFASLQMVLYRMNTIAPNIILYNDAPTTTKEDVLLLLKKAINDV